MSDPDWLADLDRFIDGDVDDLFPMPEWMRTTPAWLRSRDLRTFQLAWNGGSHTEAEWQALCAAYGHRCLRCKQQRPLTRDHVLPVVLGGRDDISNIQPLCRPCNSSKGARHIDYRPETLASE